MGLGASDVGNHVLAVGLLLPQVSADTSATEDYDTVHEVHDLTHSVTDEYQGFTLFLETAHDVLDLGSFDFRRNDEVTKPRGSINATMSASSSIGNMKRSAPSSLRARSESLPCSPALLGIRLMDSAPLFRACTMSACRTHPLESNLDWRIQGRREDGADSPERV